MISTVNESKIEYGLIEKLTDLKYTYRSDIRDRKALEDNFRKKFEALNRVNLTDAEFSRLRDEIINPDVFNASKTLRQRNDFQREDGTPLNYTLVNIKDWCKNDFEVINQLRINTENSSHRYDVLLLINGIPVAQIELKTLEISPRRAMQQIVDYKNDPGNGYTNSLLCFIQLFIVTNRSNTYYFANNRNQHFSFNADEQFLPVYQWASEDNKKITHLDDFTEKFLTKCALGEMISKYMVLVESEQKLMVMRPYQIYAVKKIIECINDNRGNGYIWHTTGSGKTLTSFKASTLLKDNHDIEKCLFVVDRKDLDKQTRDEFNKFQEGSVEENTNTESLVRRMLSEDYADKVIVTTIQKLGVALDPEHEKNYKERLKPLSQKRLVFIFDECHRSQFGDNHEAIKEFFPNAQLFGFTGTPIFEKNAIYTQVEGQEESYKTTRDIFQKELHKYTITHAIEDKNVLRFHVDYYRGEGSYKPKAGETITKRAVAEAILDKHDAATHSRRFNAILATDSINSAIDYFRLFKAIQDERKIKDENYASLNIACVFSPPPKALAEEGSSAGKNVADIRQMQEDLQQEKKDNEENAEQKKLELKLIIKDYNEQYKTNHTIGEFDLYYQDVQQRIKDQKYSNADYAHQNKIDVTIVVDMLLTGFDSKYLNTLYVDKNLKYHGLIQAFSRTNRTLHSTGSDATIKPYGNIHTFRTTQDVVDEAIEMFSGEDKDKAKEIWLVEPAPVVLAQYEKAVSALDKFMQSCGLENKPEDVNNLKGDADRAGFINRFKEVQRLKTQLDQYTDIDEESKTKMEALLSAEQLRSFKAAYLDTARRLKSKQTKEGEQAPPDVQQLDFEFVLFASALVDYDYIMALIARSTQAKPAKQKMTKEQVINLLCSSANLMEHRDDIIAYINSLDWNRGRSVQEIEEGFQKFMEEKSEGELATIAHNHGLETTALKNFVDGIMSRMIFDGEKLNDLLAPLQLGWKERTSKELGLMQELLPLLKKIAHGREISGLSAYEH